MSENMQIDNLDKKILDIITKNARIPYLEVARECGVSGAAIHQRVQRLIRIGVIKGSEFKVDPVMVGFKTCAYIGIFLDHPGHFREVITKFRDIPEINHEILVPVRVSPLREDHLFVPCIIDLFYGKLHRGC